MKRTMAGILACLFVSVAFAQVNKSNLVGIIRDPTGAVIPGVSVRLINTGTGATRNETSEAAGLYRFTAGDPGIYRLEAEQSGFKKFVREGIQLITGETITVDDVRRRR